MSKALRVLLPVAAIVALGVLLWSRGGDRAPLGGASEAHEEHVPPELLTADGLETPQPARVAPTLAPGKTSVEVRRGPVRVRVVGPGDDPVPGVRIGIVAGRGSMPEPLFTDAQGYARLGPLPYDGSVELAVYAPEPWREGAFIPSLMEPRAGHPRTPLVTGPELLFRAQTGIAVDFTAVNAETGGSLAGTEVRCRKALTEEGRGWTMAPRRFLMTPGIGRLTVMHWDVVPPKGWIAWDPHWVKTTISPYARALDFHYPVRREVDVAITPVDSEGTPVDARVRMALVAGRKPQWSIKGDAYGRLRLHGVPFLRDEILDVTVCRKDLSGPARVRLPIPDQPGTPIDVQVTLPDDGEVSDIEFESIGIGGGAGGAFKGRMRYRKFDNALVVRVIRRNGEPAVGATVELAHHSARTDAHGRVRFRGIAPGVMDVQVRQPGLVPITRTVDIPQRGEAKKTLREGKGGIVDLAVVDDGGNSLSYAAFRVKTGYGAPWAYVDLQNRQRIDPFTDHLGRRRLHAIGPGDFTIDVSWGSRRKSVSLRVEEGETRAVRVVLPRPR